MRQAVTIRFGQTPTVPPRGPALPAEIGRAVRTVDTCITADPTQKGSVTIALVFDVGTEREAFEWGLDAAKHLGALFDVTGPLEISLAPAVVLASVPA